MGGDWNLKLFSCVVLSPVCNQHHNIDFPFINTNNIPSRLLKMFIVNKMDIDNIYCSSTGWLWQSLTISRLVRWRVLCPERSRSILTSKFILRSSGLSWLSSLALMALHDVGLKSPASRKLKTLELSRQD